MLNCVSVDMRLLLVQGGSGLGENTQSASSTAVAVIFLHHTSHCIATETLSTVLSTSDGVSCRVTVIGTASGGIAVAPKSEGARVSVRNEIGVASLISPCL